MDSNSKGQGDVFLPNRLKYKKGDLIIKEGDYGVSIYQVVRGEVEVYTKKDGEKITLETLGPGELFGEMAFLGAAKSTRAASVRALEDCDLDVLHAAHLAKEYREIPPMLKHIWDHSLRRLLRMNKMIADLSVAPVQKKKEKVGGPGAEARKSYRKPINLRCTYRPCAAAQRFLLHGYIVNISNGGLGMEVDAQNLLDCYHNPGDEFQVETTLPNRKSLSVTGKIVFTRKVSGTEYMIAMCFVRLTQENQKTLGYFLMK
ncbi:cyclic nucleotide-binding domain-containing protein [Thermodesulfobacteriota bacterium]